MTEKKEVSRRGYVKYAAAGIIVVAGAAAGGYYATRPRGPTTPTPTEVKPTPTEAKPTATITPTTTVKREKILDDYAEAVSMYEDMASMQEMQQFKGESIKAVMHFTPHSESDIIFHDLFEALTGINLTVELYDEPKQREVMVLDYGAGTGEYDAGGVSFPYLAEYIDAGYLDPVDPLIDELGFTMIEPLDSGKEIARCQQIPFYKDMDESKERYGWGKCLYVPSEVWARYDILRDLMLDELSPANGKFPDSVSEYDEYCELFLKLKKEGKIDEDVYAITSRLAPTHESYQTCGGFTQAWGAGELIDTDTGEMLPDYNAWTENFKWVNRMFPKYAQPGAASQSWPEWLPRTLEGKQAQLFEHSWWNTLIMYNGVPEIYGETMAEREKGENMLSAGCISGPAPESQPGGNRMRHESFIDAYCINANSKSEGKKRAAYLFTQWKTAFATEWLELKEETKYGGGPVRLNLGNYKTFNSDRYQNIIKKWDYGQDYVKMHWDDYVFFIENNQQAGWDLVQKTWAWYGGLQGPIPEAFEMAMVMQMEISSTAAGKNPENALKDAHDKLTTLSRKYGYMK